MKLGTGETATPSVTDCLVENDVSLADALADEPDLEKIKAAMIREYAIRRAMAETGEDRETVSDMIDALGSMDQEAVLELTSGAPTTLADGLREYIETLEQAPPDSDDEIMIPVATVIGGLHALLMYPWSDEEATIATHGANASVALRVERPDDEYLEVYVGGQVVAQANHEEHGWAGMSAVETTAEAVHRAVLARVIGDRPRHVSISQTDRLDLLNWLDRPNGSWRAGGTDRLSVNALEGGGILIRTQPFTYVTPPATRSLRRD